MALKIRPEDYVRMEQAVQAVMAAHPEITVESYRAQGLSDMRFRWDALKVSTFTTQDVCALYSYLNDDHIDSALRRITGTK